ncbi:MAG: molybdate ABC transporter substrate-binding protein [Gammaproteobacteria bacterium]|nr:molybdate ABC transporter substrate-binding protein [Gammaproteobacteria bacterium]
MKPVLIPYAFLLWMLCTLPAAVAELRIAAASNFNAALESIAHRFEAQSGHRVRLSFGASGKHFAQIRNGAPFDLFFSADTKRPTLLEQEGLALPGSRFTYAVGKLVLWSPREDYIDADGQVLDQGSFRYIAIANPRLAPYGKAARQVLQARGLWEKMRPITVRGENIGQTFQFVSSGNAELGFVAYSQIRNPDQKMGGSFWRVPQSLYTPIQQQAVLLKDSDPARSFLKFVKSEKSLAILKQYGYGVP